MKWLEYHEEPVELHSGDRSHWLVRGDLIFADEALRELVLRSWKEQIGIFPPRPYNFVGVPSGGTPWTEAIAEYMEGWVWDSIEACAPDGTYFVVDDVVTTGNSLGVAKDKLTLAGAEHVEQLVVVDRRGGWRRDVTAWATIHLPFMEKERGIAEYEAQRARDDEYAYRHGGEQQ